MDEYECYIKIIKSILKYSKNDKKYDTLIPIFLNKMCYEYYTNRNLKEYNLDNLYKKYLPLIYICLDQKYNIQKKILIMIYEYL